ncbi:MAG: MFS transporter [Elusimicrobia bacterium]|nr:MFS transporter [Elusimicrobiota bacterium]
MTTKQIETSALKTGLQWSLYDFGNSAYALNIITLFFPLYFSSFVSSNPATWSRTVAVSILASALIAPIAGYFADRYSARRISLIAFASLAVVGTLLLGFTTSSAETTIIFIATNIAFYVSTSFYDAILVTIARDRRTFTSGLGWAIGYFGGLLCLGFCYLMLGSQMPTNQGDFLKVFFLTGLFYMVSSLFFFRNLSPDSDAHAASLAVSRSDMAGMGSDFRGPLLYVLIGSFLVMEGVTTIVYFTAIYASSTLHFSIGRIAGLLSLTQLIAAPATYLICRYAERRQNEFTILIMCNVVWLLLALAMFKFRSPLAYIGIACLTGLVIGTSPALLRACLSKITPPHRRGSIFGFSLLCSRAASVVGPLVFGLVASKFSAPVGMLSVIPFFVLGSIILFSASVKISALQTHA